MLGEMMSGGVRGSGEGVMRSGQEWWGEGEC